MGLIKKVKLWWRSTTPTEKILTVLGGVTTTASVVGAVCAVKTYTEMEDKLSVEVRLYPNGNGDQNPIKLEGEKVDSFDELDKKEVDFSKPVPSPADNGSYDPYELARDIFNTIATPFTEEDLKTLPKETKLIVWREDLWSDAAEKSLQLAWDLAAREGVLDKAEAEIPLQVHD